MFTKEMIKKILEKYNDHERLVIATDIVEGRGINGIEYLKFEFKYYYKDLYSKDKKLMSIHGYEIDEITEDFIIIKQYILTNYRIDKKISIIPLERITMVDYLNKVKECIFAY